MYSSLSKNQAFLKEFLPSATKSEKKVLNYLITLGLSLRTVKISNGVIARKAGVCRRTVIRVINKLDGVVLERRERFYRSRQRCNWYVVLDWVLQPGWLQWMAQWCHSLRRFPALLLFSVLPVMVDVLGGDKAYCPKMSHRYRKNGVIYNNKLRSNTSLGQQHTKSNFEERWVGNVVGSVLRDGGVGLKKKCGLKRERDMAFAPEAPDGVIFSSEQMTEWMALSQAERLYATEVYEKAIRGRVQVSNPAAWLLAVARKSRSQGVYEPVVKRPASSAPTTGPMKSVAERAELFMDSYYTDADIIKMRRQAASMVDSARKSNESERELQWRLDYFAALNKAYEQRMALKQELPEEPVVSANATTSALGAALAKMMPESCQQELVGRRAERVDPRTRNNPVLDHIVRTHLQTGAPVVVSDEKNKETVE